MESTFNIYVDVDVNVDIYASYFLSRSLIASSSSVDLAASCSTARASNRTFRPLSSQSVIRSCVRSNACAPRLRRVTDKDVDVNVDDDVDGNVSVTVSVFVAGDVDGCVSGFTNFLLSLGTADHLLHQCFVSARAGAGRRIVINTGDLVVCLFHFNVTRNHCLKKQLAKVVPNSGQHIGTHAGVIVQVRDYAENRQGDIQVITQFLHGFL